MAYKKTSRTEEGIQINKYISSSGFCSRREADKLIEQGRVSIDDDLALLTTRVRPGQTVAVDGEKIKLKKASQSLYIAFNKPIGVTSTTDPKDKTNIIYFMNHPKRIFPIGRLDKDSEGLILLTNDGDIVNKILRAENDHEKEYIVTLSKPISPEFLRKMAAGVELGPSTFTLPCFVRQEGTKKFRIILTQGLNRQIRRMCEALGFEVMSLKRVRIMNIQLDQLKVGQWRYLSPNELSLLNENLIDSSNSEQQVLNKPARTSPRIKQKKS